MDVKKLRIKKGFQILSVVLYVNVVGIFGSAAHFTSLNGDFLILRDQYHYCTGSNILNTVKDESLRPSILNHCLEDERCSYITIGPRWPGLSARWLCSGGDWISREHNRGWTLAVKKSVFTVPGYHVKVNTGISECSMLGVPQVGQFSIENAYFLCKRNPDCVGFGLNYAENRTAMSPRHFGPLSVELTLCSDSPTTMLVDGWVTVEKIRIDTHAREDISTSRKPKAGILRAHELKSAASKDNTGPTTGIITQHQYWYPLPEPGALYPA